MDNQDTPYYPFAFEGPVAHHALGTCVYTVVFLPAMFVKELPLQQHPRLRISGELNDVPFSGAWQPVRGLWYLMLSKQVLKDANLKLGDMASLRFRLEDQKAVDVPQDLLVLLEKSPKLKRVWTSLSAGKQRGHAHRLASAKTAPTRAKRLAKVLADLSALL